MQGMFKTPEEAVAHVRNSLRFARKEKSKLSEDTPQAKGILGLLGMSGKCTRHLLNNLASPEGIRYVEVGSHLGSTYCSAIYQNKDIGLAASMDNWSQFVISEPPDENQVKDTFLENVKRVVAANGTREVDPQYLFFERDYKDFDFDGFGQ